MLATSPLPVYYRNQAVIPLTSNCILFEETHRPNVTTTLQQRVDGRRMRFSAMEGLPDWTTCDSRVGSSEPGIPYDKKVTQSATIQMVRVPVAIQLYN